MIQTSVLFTPPEVANTGTRFLTGGPGAAPGGVASKNGWVYMRVQRGVISYSRVCPYLVCCYKTAVGVENGLLERLRVCRGEARNQLRGLKEGGSARRGAMLCLPADLTSHAFNVSTAHPVGFENGREREREGGAGAPRRTGRMNREGEVCSLVTCGVHFGARRRARARRRCVPRQLRLSTRSSECCGTREEEEINHW